MKKFLLMISLLSFLVLGITPAWAGSGNGTITTILSESPGVVFFYVSNTAAVACATAQRFAVDTNSQGGKSIYAQMLALYLAGKQAQIVGDGTCAIWGDSEDVLYVYNMN